MAHVRRLPFLCVAVAILALRQAEAQISGNSRVVTVDLVRAKPGERDRLIRFYQLNWEAARRTALAQGVITGYRLFVRADTSGVWDVLLETEYPDSAAHARREEIFRPILRAKGRILVDGLDRPALGESVESRDLRVVAASP